MRFGSRPFGASPLPFGLLQEQINRLLRDFKQGCETDASPDSITQWSPDLDMRETPDAFEILADVPGLTADELQISIDDSVLTLRGTRKPAPSSEGQSIHVLERPYGSFSRSLRLPAIVDVDNVGAETKNGVLRITLPKKAEAKPRQVAVKVK